MTFFEGQTTPLFDASTTSAMRRRMVEAAGVVMIGAGLLLAICLATYNIDDPSFFSATGLAPTNWLGEWGAAVADPLMRFLGLAAWGFVAFPVIWGLRLCLGAGAERVLMRLPLLPIGLILGAVFAALHLPWAAWPLSTGLGGVLGDHGARALIGVTGMVPGGGLRLLTAVVGLMFLFAAGIGLGATRSEVLGAFRWMVRSLFSAVTLLVIVLVTTTRRLATQIITAIRAWRAKPRSETLPPATPTTSWRLRLGKQTASPTRAATEPAPPVMAPAPLTDPDDAPAGERVLSTAIRNLTGGPMPDLTPRDEDLPDLSAVDFETVPSPPVERSAAPVRKSKRAEAERQPVLGLDGLKDPAEYDAPALALLQKPRVITRTQTSDSALEDNARMLETVLEDYGVRGEIVAVKPGPVVTLYELEPAPGLKASRVIGLADDIARSMSALAARVSTVPGRSVIGIELPNDVRETVYLRDLFEAPDYGDSRMPLALALGKSIAGTPVVANLAKMPHLLIAGTTGSGKSVAINTMILSLLYRLSPEQCRMIMIDPKMLELSVYDGIPHLLAPVVTDPKKAIVALKWVVAEMEDRYRKMSKMGVRNIDGYNARVRDALAKGEDFSRTVQTGFDEATGEPIYETESIEPHELPYIVVIVDEMADLMMVAGKEIEACIQRLAQMARASGIHLIMATQRPSVDVITGTIKANFPTRISFQVTSKIDSRTILGEQGAEQLLGQGDMLYMAGGGRLSRVHGPFVSDDEVEEVVSHLKTLGVPSYIEAVTEGVDDEAQALVDEKLGLAAADDTEAALYDRAVAIVARDRKCSTSYIQRKLAIGYNKAARLVEEMEAQGVVTRANAVGKRDILIEER